jgi:flagellar biosynthetic protein FlhB
VTLIELLKNVAKLSLVFYIAYQTISKYRQDILFASTIGISDAMVVAGSILSSFFIKIAVLFMAVALLDLAVQRWNFMKNMRMSKDEVKREYKQDEGDPHVKGERKRLHREMVFGDARKNVKKADAMVTNPIHVAVAIQYDKNEMAAPEILVKGQRSYAEMLIQIAKEEGIPIVRNIPLAWSLLALDEGDAIPEELYEPVAEVLSYVYEMKERERAVRENAAALAAAGPQTGKPGDTKSSPGAFDPF